MTICVAAIYESKKTRPYLVEILSDSIAVKIILIGTTSSVLLFVSD